MRRTWSSIPCNISWPPFFLPLFTSDGLNLYFYALPSPFWTVARYSSPRAESTPVESGSRTDLWAGEKKLPAAQADAGYACDAPWNKGGSQGRFTRTGLLGAVEHRFYRAGESDRTSLSGSAGTPHLGHGPASSTTLSPPGMVASLLSLCASACITTSGTREAASARWQADRATLPTVYRSSGSGKNQPAMDSAGSALLSLATGTTLHLLIVNEVRCAWNHEFAATARLCFQFFSALLCFRRLAEKNGLQSYIFFTHLPL